MPQTLTSTFSNIANAIRSKTGKSDTIMPIDMPGEIMNISSSGESSGIDDIFYGNITLSKQFLNNNLGTSTVDYSITRETGTANGYQQKILPDDSFLINYNVYNAHVPSINVGLPVDTINIYANTTSFSTIYKTAGGFLKRYIYDKNIESFYKYAEFTSSTASCTRMPDDSTNGFILEGNSALGFLNSTNVASEFPITFRNITNLFGVFANAAFNTQNNQFLYDLANISDNVDVRYMFAGSNVNINVPGLSYQITSPPLNKVIPKNKKDLSYMFDGYISSAGYLINSQGEEIVFSNVIENTSFMFCNAKFTSLVINKYSSNLRNSYAMFLGSDLMYLSPTSRNNKTYYYNFTNTDARYMFGGSSYKYIPRFTNIYYNFTNCDIRDIFYCNNSLAVVFENTTYPNANFYLRLDNTSAFRIFGNSNGIYPITQKNFYVNFINGNYSGMLAMAPNDMNNFCNVKINATYNVGHLNYVVKNPTDLSYLFTSVNTTGWTKLNTSPYGQNVNDFFKKMNTFTNLKSVRGMFASSQPSITNITQVQWNLPSNVIDASYMFWNCNHIGGAANAIDSNKQFFPINIENLAYAYGGVNTYNNIGTYDTFLNRYRIWEPLIDNSYHTKDISGIFYGHSLNFYYSNFIVPQSMGNYITLGKNIVNCAKMFAETRRDIGTTNTSNYTYLNNFRIILSENVENASQMFYNSSINEYRGVISPLIMMFNKATKLKDISGFFSLYPYNSSSKITSLTFNNAADVNFFSNLSDTLEDCSYLFANLSAIYTSDKDGRPAKYENYGTLGLNIKHVDGMFAGYNNTDITTYGLPAIDLPSSVLTASRMYYGLKAYNNRVVNMNEGILDISGMYDDPVSPAAFNVYGSLNLPKSVMNASRFLDGQSYINSLEINIPEDHENLTDISYMFNGCSNYNSKINVPRSVINGERAFYFMNNYNQEINLPGSNLIQGCCMYSYMNKATIMDFGNQFKRLNNLGNADYMFHNVGTLNIGGESNIYLPKSLTSAISMFNGVCFTNHINIYYPEHLYKMSQIFNNITRGDLSINFIPYYNNDNTYFKMRRNMGYSFCRTSNIRNSKIVIDRYTNNLEQAFFAVNFYDSNILIEGFNDINDARRTAYCMNNGKIWGRQANGVFSSITMSNCNIHMDITGMFPGTGSQSIFAGSARNIKANVYLYDSLNLIDPNYTFTNFFSSGFTLTSDSKFNIYLDKNLSRYKSEFLSKISLNSTQHPLTMVNENTYRIANATTSYIFFNQNINFPTY